MDKEIRNENYCPRDLQSDRRLTGIRFVGGQRMLGLQLLLEHGSAQMYPGWIAVSRRSHIDRAILTIVEAQVPILVNHNLPVVTKSNARSLADLPGWRKP